MMILSVVISALGYFTILTLAAFNPEPAAALAWRKPLVGSIFASMCILGLVLALTPRKCSETIDHTKTPRKTASSLPASNSVATIKGHHYDCGRFSAHIIRVRGHVLCAACTGLFLGALVALFATALYFFAESELQQIDFLDVVLGVATMILGFFQMKSRGFARLLLNFSFVLGGFLILAAIDGLVQSLSVDLLTIALIAFWIFTRILLSQWDHSRTCRTCSITCENRIKEKWS
jgi:uncharacterized membrane protein